MKNRKKIITAGIISLLLLLLLTGCGTELLKSGQNTSREQTVAEDGSSEGAPVGDTDTGEPDEDTSTDGSSGEPVEDGSGPEPTENPETNCSSLNPHPMAEGMAEQFDVTYDEVMTWYCDGYAFSDILLALETELLVDQSAEELLSMFDNQTWEEIWVELGVEK